MRSFIIFLIFVSLLAVCLFACNHHSSQSDVTASRFIVGNEAGQCIDFCLKNISVLEDLPEVDKAYYALLLAEATDKQQIYLYCLAIPY